MPAAGLLGSDQQPVAEDRAGENLALGTGYQELGRVDEDDVDLVLARARPVAGARVFSSLGEAKILSCEANTLWWCKSRIQLP